MLQRPKSLRELALEHLRNSIIDGSLEMGQILSERKISEELGVSKSPVREALAQLRDEGLVSIEPQKGARVFSLSEEEVSQICDFRQAIEIAAFELALVRDPVGLSVEMSRVVEEMARKRDKSDERGYLSLDTTFHHLIFEKSGKYLSDRKLRSVYGKDCRFTHPFGKVSATHRSFFHGASAHFRRSGSRRYG